MDEWEAQTTGWQDRLKDIGTTWTRKPVFGNNCKWKVTFKIFIKRNKNSPMKN